ncbi:transposase family protein [Microvirga lotononidis]|uniref:Transposase family protein n=1 Tax=Microvirga lotononidis TaxID=864069 RepID=I4Z2S0_9HYPH|nr:transposase family protein [Microvirga lotononidis]
MEILLLHLRLSIFSEKVQFALLPKRWIVERTFAWLVRNTRLAKDWEGLPTTTETWTYLATSRLMTKRSAHAAA